jgi:hypothetical protein
MATGVGAGEATSTPTSAVATVAAGDATATPGAEATRDPNLPTTGQSTWDVLGLVIVLAMAALLLGTGIREARRRL